MNDDLSNANNKPKSAIEQLIDVESYNDLVYKVNELDIPETGYGDGKNYFPEIGRIVWQTVVLTAKPKIANNSTEKEAYLSIYKVVYAFAKAGEYPLMQQLCNYLGENLDNFLLICRTPGHPLHEPYEWVYRVFDAAASLNAIRSNGNANIRVWLDKSREQKIAIEDRIELSLEASKINKLKSLGEDIEKSLLEE